MFCKGKVTSAYDMSPIEAVPVSDGRNIVFTNNDGEFELDTWEGAHVLNLGILTYGHNDWFIYIDGHVGDFDFSPRPVSVKGDFCFLHTTDTEIETRPFSEWTAFAREKVISESPAFFAHTGDLCRREGVKKHYLTFNSEVVGCPVRYAIGNHDFIGDAYGEEIYERLYGPTWYSFDCGDIHFAVLSIGKGDKPSGYSRADQLIWLKKDLELMDKNKRLIVLDHDLCSTDPLGFCPSWEDVRVELPVSRLAAWVFGHYHVSFHHVVNGVHSITSSRPDSGGIDSSPAGIRRIDVKDGEISSRFLYNMPQPEGSDPFIWQTQLEGVISYSTPKMWDGDVFVATAHDGYPKECGIYRLSGKDGSICWRFKAENGIKGELAFDDGRIYAQDDNGWLYCLEADGGRLIWKTRSSLPKDEYTRFAPLVAGDAVIGGNSVYIYAYNKANGDPLWEKALSISENSPAKHIYDEKRNRLLLSRHWRGLTSLSLDSGETVWEYTDHPLWFRTSTPLLEDDTIYAAGNESIIAVDAGTGESLAENHLGYRLDVSGAPTLDGDTLYFPSGNMGVFSADRNTLRLKEHFPTERTRLYSSPYIYGNIQTVEGSPVIHNELIIFTSSDGYLYLYGKDDGQLRRRIYLGAPSTVSPLVGKGWAITADFSGRVTKFKL